MSAKAKTFRSVYITLCVLLAVFFCGPPATAAGLLAGAAKRSIVPPFPTHMGGFMDRKDTFQGVHDEVFVRALVLDNGKTSLVILGSDLTAIDADMAKQIRERIEKETGIPPAAVLVSCAHNHSAPSIYEPGRLQESKMPVKKFFVEQFSQAAIDAFTNRKQARAGFRAGQLRGATTNRQQGNDLIDSQVGVLRVEERDSRKTIATLFNFTGHPVIIGSNNLNLSGEYPGAACRAIENLMGGVAIFTQGAAGDVTVHRSGDPFQEIERVGRTVAGEVIKTAGFIRGTDNISLAAVSKSVPLQPQNFPSIEEAQKSLEQAQTELTAARKNRANAQFQRSIRQLIQMHSTHLRIAKGIKDGKFKFPDVYQAEIQVLQIGELIIVAVPGELFVEYALEMRSRVKQTLGKQMFLAGYSNGYIGYIITPRAARTGGYEASVARITIESGRILTETAMDLLTDLTDKQ